MKQEPLILTFDFGTQSVRASVYDKKGACLAFKQKTYEPAYFSPKPGYAEMDPNYYFECLCECSKALAKENPELLERVAGIEIDCFRDSAVLLDKDRITPTDLSEVGYPIRKLGWDIDVQFNPVMYTMKDWESRSFTPFYKNVMKEGVAL